MSSNAPAIVNMNIAGPTLVIPVTAAGSAATAGKAMSGRLVSAVLKHMIIPRPYDQWPAQVSYQVTFCEGAMPDICGFVIRATAPVAEPARPQLPG
ncbi:MAG: hypothetical protein IH911_07790 [Proteobacteria bacterium]|nr:hypothetical protein [Pseudomonadota bacterium]